MGRTSFLRTRTVAGALITLLGGGALLYELRGQTTIESPDDSSGQVILEVINRHFTVGQKIPSLYLRIFSDRTVECHPLSYTGKEADAANKKYLRPEGFKRIKALIDKPELLKVKKRYELTHPVFDSWMEWDIKIQHPDGVQEISVANFSPGSTRGPSQPYPDALVMLGCSISKLRDELCGNEPEYRRYNCSKLLPDN
jgi:hypothetical protein